MKKSDIEDQDGNGAGINSDPYDLQVVDYNTIEKKNQHYKKEYYTISIKGLCHYVGGYPIEFISLANWLKERDDYDKIKALPFFNQFRKWKTLTMWKRNVTRNKSNGYKD